MPKEVTMREARHEGRQVAGVGKRRDSHGLGTGNLSGMAWTRPCDVRIRRVAPSAPRLRAMRFVLVVAFSSARHAVDK